MKTSQGLFTHIYLPDNNSIHFSYKRPIHSDKQLINKKKLKILPFFGIANNNLPLSDSDNKSIFYFFVVVVERRPILKKLH